MRSIRYRAQGLSPREARRRALRDLGGLATRTEECRDTRGLRWVDDAAGDVRIATRTLRRRPGFTALVLTVLALGIGATVTMFSIAYGALFRPMPFPRSDRLVAVSAVPGQGHTPFGRMLGLDEGDYLAIEGADRAFDGLTSWWSAPATLTGAGVPRHVSMAYVTPQFFGVLNARPMLGRLLDQRDAHERADVIAVSHQFWQDALGGRPDVVGRVVTLDGASHTIAGVLPQSFDFPDRTDVWAPFEVTVNPHLSMLRPAVARLKPGVTRRQAQSELERLAETGVIQAWGHQRADAQVLPLVELVIGDSRRPLLIFTAAVGLVLLIASANVAGLLIVRTAERDRELEVRAALGAPYGRLLRQLLAESLLLAIWGGGLGALLAYAALPAIVHAAPAGTIPRMDAIRVDLVPLLFALVVSILLGVVVGTAPAIKAARHGRQAATGGTRTASDAQDRLRAGLVVAEVALSLTLLAGAGIMIRSFVAMRAVDPGFHADRALTATIDLPKTYDTATKAAAFDAEVVDRLASRPGVTSAATVNWLPLGQGLISGDVTRDHGRSLPAGFMAAKLVVSPGYFRTMGMRLLDGRGFSRSDRADAPGVVIVSQSVAHALWPGEKPIGQRLSMKDHPAAGDWLTVIGVVNDVHQTGLMTPTMGATYQPALQTAVLSWLTHLTLVVTPTGEASPVADAIRETVRAVDPNQAPPTVRSMTDVIDRSTATPQFQAWLLTAFAALALVLTLVGIYGVLAYAVSRRTREFGVRMALGADAAAIVALVARRTAWLVAFGVVVGMAGAVAATRLLSTFLFEVTPTDPLTLATVVALLLLAASAAAAVPAWRATRVNPVEALRAE